MHYFYTIINAQDKKKYISILTIFLLIIFYYNMTSDDQAVGYLTDDAVYLFMAELYSPWFNTHLPVHELLRSEYRFPPLYPIILGVFGATTSAPHIATYINVILLVFTCAVSAIFCLKITNNYYLSIILSLIFAFTPGTLIMSQGIWSEFLYMFIMYSLFITMQHVDENPKTWIFAALLVSMLILTRTIGISAYIPYVMFVIFKKPKNRYLLILLPILPYLAWSINRYILFDQSSYLEDITFQYSPDTLQIYLKYLFSKLTLMLNSFEWLFALDYILENSYRHIIIISLLIFSLIGFIIRIKNRAFDAYVLIIYLAFIIVWPYDDIHFTSRFLFPLLPLFLIYIITPIQYIQNYKNIILHAIYTLLFIVLILIYPATKHVVTNAYVDISPELNPFKRNRSWLMAKNRKHALTQVEITMSIAQQLRIIQDNVGINDCIFSTHPSVTMLYTKRISYLLPNSRISDEEFMGATNYCKYILAMPISDINSVYPSYYPLQRNLDMNKYKIYKYASKYNVELYLLKK